MVLFSTELRTVGRYSQDYLFFCIVLHEACTARTLEASFTIRDAAVFDYPELVLVSDVWVH